MIKHVKRISLPLLLCFAVTASANEVSVEVNMESILEIGRENQTLSASSQDRIDNTERQTDKLINEYKVVSKQVEGLKLYNAQKRIQIQAQLDLMDKLDEQLVQVVVMQRQIPPLSRRMYEGLKSFISLDLPFRLGEREERLSFIQKALDNPTVSPAEQLRQVLEGYTVESEYGMKMDTYKDTITIDGQDREVNILRVGRLVLAYQTSDLDQTGVWNKETNTWEELPSRYRNPVKNGIRIAQKLQTVNILEMPIPAAGVVQ